MSDACCCVPSGSQGLEDELAAVHISRDVLNELMPGNEVVVLPTIELRPKPLYSLAKRSFDFVACSVALIVMIVPLLVIAVMIKVDSPGPVLYSQYRLGKGGRVFRMYKLRSMYIDAERDGACWTSGTDARITPMGRVLRRTRLDELPQLINVIRGDMSLIGPRPERPAFAFEFEKRIVGFHQRTLIRPGVSGLAQVLGGYDLLPKDKVVYDLEYIRNRGVALDLKIILKTIGVVCSGRGAR